jgi:hypothetical protein
MLLTESYLTDQTPVMGILSSVDRCRRGMQAIMVESNMSTFLTYANTVSSLVSLKIVDEVVPSFCFYSFRFYICMIIF